MISGIYKIVNKINGKYYVGSSSNISGSRGRWAKHKRMLTKNTHPNQHLQNAWNKYGFDNFDWVIIEKTPKEILLETEQKYLDTAKSEKEKCYNQSFIAGKIEMTKEVCQKISSANRQRIWTEETRKLISANNTKENHPLWGKRFSKKKCNIGKNNPMFDKTIYEFTNGSKNFIGSRLDFSKIFSNRKSAEAAVSAMIHKKKNSHLGWELKNES